MEEIINEIIEKVRKEKEIVLSFKITDKPQLDYLRALLIEVSKEIKHSELSSYELNETILKFLCKILILKEI